MRIMMGLVLIAFYSPVSRRYTFGLALKSVIFGRQLSTAPIQINHEAKQGLDLQYGIMAAGD
jgi:hypothetical protein